MIKCLIHPLTHEIVAELTPDKEIKILNEDMLTSLCLNGINVTQEFKDLHRTGWTVYPTDSKEIFAKAFEQFRFVHGLQQRGYFWVDKHELEASPEERAREVLSSYEKFKNKK